MPPQAHPSHRAARPASTPAKQRLLDAAERLFAERGFEGTSIRAVTQSAGVSVSAANYHFGSKEELLHATLRRRVEPLNRARLARLQAAERAAGEHPPSVEAIVDAFLRPVFELGRGFDPPERPRQLAARLFSDPPDVVSTLRRDLFGEVTDRFVGALETTLPGSERDEVALALEFVVGIMVHAIGGQLSLSCPRTNRAPALSEDRVADRMIAFAAQGLRHCLARTAQGGPK